jgi:hypothetical protein
MNKSESIKELATALAKAQTEIKGAVKDSENPYFKSKYADLESVWDACRDALTKNGLAVIQLPTDAGEGRIGMETILVHSSGEWVSGAFSMIPKDTSPQAVGSCITYARRYGLAAVAGVHQTDDDAEGAMNRGGKPQAKSDGSNKDMILEEIGELMKLLKADKKEAIRDIVFGDKTKAQIRLMTLTELGHAKETIVAYIQQSEEAFWDAYKEIQSAASK